MAGKRGLSGMIVSQSVVRSVGRLREGEQVGKQVAKGCQERIQQTTDDPGRAGVE
jgi:hypothetical protein